MENRRESKDLPHLYSSLMAFCFVAFRVIPLNVIQLSYLVIHIRVDYIVSVFCVCQWFRSPVCGVYSYFDWILCVTMIPQSSLSLSLINILERKRIQPLSCVNDLFGIRRFSIFRKKNIWFLLFSLVLISNKVAEKLVRQFLGFSWEFLDV